MIGRQKAAATVAQTIDHENWRWWLWRITRTTRREWRRIRWDMDLLALTMYIYLCEPQWHVDLLVLLQHPEQSLSSRPRRWLSPGNRRSLDCIVRDVTKNVWWQCPSATGRWILFFWCWVPYCERWAPRAMVPNVASCKIVNTFLCSRLNQEQNDKRVRA